MLKKAFGLQQKIAQRYLSGNDQGRVLMIHQVNDDKSNWSFPDTAITEKNFKHLIDGLVERGYFFITPDQIKDDMEIKSILITFDDPFEDGIENGAMYLISQCIPFTVFITKDFIGEKNYITKKHFEMLMREPLCTIGSHCMTHSMLRQMNQDDCQKELSESKQFLETITERKIEILAYPYGSVFSTGKREKRLARAAGYKMAFSTLSAGLNFRSLRDKFFLPRYNINDSNYERHLNDIKYKS